MRLILIALVLFLSASSVAPKRSQTPNISRTSKSESTQIGSENKSRQADNEVTPKHSTVANQISPKQTEAERGQFDQQVQVQRRVAYFTGALVLVGFLQFLAAIIYASVAYCQLQTIKRQARIGVGALIIARRSANAAKQSADTSQQQMNLGLRSYIYISKAELVWLHHEKPKIVYTIRNGGKIPATIIGMYEDFRIIKQMPEKAEFGAAVKKSIPVAPGSDQTGNTSHTRISLSAEEIEQINSGDAYLYFCGRILSLDSLNQKMPNMTFFGFRTTDDDVPVLEGGSPIELSFMDEPSYNRID